MSYKNKALIVLSIISFIQITNAKEMTDEDYEGLFEKVTKINKYDLGPQCAYKNLGDVLQAEALVDRADYKLSYDDFLKEVYKRGLFDKKLFHNPKNTDPKHEENAISSILLWTKYDQDNKLVYSPEKCFMSDKEILSIFYYTGEGYKILNSAIRNNDEHMLQKLEIIGLHLGIGLQKLKPYVGYVKRIRALDTNDEAVIKKFNEENEKGKILPQHAYTSTTVGMTTFQGNVEYIIKTHKKCYYIADFSLVEQKVKGGFSQIEEEEVLCLPETNFKVLYHNIENGMHKIVMEEVD